MSAELGLGVDALPGCALAPEGRLAERVDELNARARARWAEANDTHALLVVHTAPTRSESERERYLQTVFAAMRAALPGSELVARLGSRAAAAIVPREPRLLRDAVRALNAQIDVAVWENRLPTTRVCIERIPTSGRRLADLLHDL